jgi:hypothetical protein
MAHFAELNEDNVVTQVIVVANEELLVDGVESEAKGIEFCESLFGGRWIQTSYSASVRKNYAGIDFLYDEDKDAFIAPKTFESWVLDEDTCRWQAPVAPPLDDKYYTWNEQELNWVLAE